MGCTGTAHCLVLLLILPAVVVRRSAMAVSMCESPAATIAAVRGMLESARAGFLENLKVAHARLKAVEEQLLRSNHQGTTSCNDDNPYPTSCAHIQALGHTESGIFTIWPKYPTIRTPFKVYCDLSTDGGGWTVIHRRGDFGRVHENFFRNWTDYRAGFGNLMAEFWLGNEKLFVLANQDRTVLRVELEDFEGQQRYAQYETFWLEDEPSGYKLHLDDYVGDAGDSLSYHKGAPFSTPDRDRDEHGGNCAQAYFGGWWFRNCIKSNLNGKYYDSDHCMGPDGIEWGHWKGYSYSLRRAEMKLRPAIFESKLKNGDDGIWRTVVP